MCVTAGAGAAPDRVARMICRDGPPSASSRTAMSSRRSESASVGDERDADARGDETLHDGVVVGLEGDVGLEAGGVAGAHDVARARARGRGLHPRLPAEVLQAQAARSASGWPRAARRAAGPRAARRGEAVRADRLAAPGNSNSSARSNSPARRRGTVASGSASARLSSTRGGPRGTRRSPAASASRPRSGRTPCAGGRRVTPRSRGGRPRRRRCRARIASAWAMSARPAAVGRTPRRSRSTRVAPVSASSVAMACDTAEGV